MKWINPHHLTLCDPLGFLAPKREKELLAIHPAEWPPVLIESKDGHLRAVRGDSQILVARKHNFPVVRCQRADIIIVYMVRRHDSSFDVRTMVIDKVFVDLADAQAYVAGEITGRWEFLVANDPAFGVIAKGVLIDEITIIRVEVI